MRKATTYIHSHVSTRDTAHSGTQVFGTTAAKLSIPLAFAWFSAVSPSWRYMEWIDLATNWCLWSLEEAEMECPFGMSGWRWLQMIWCSLHWKDKWSIISSTMALFTFNWVTCGLHAQHRIPEKYIIFWAASREQITKWTEKKIVWEFRMELKMLWSRIIDRKSSQLYNYGLPVSHLLPHL